MHTALTKHEYFDTLLPQNRSFLYRIASKYTTDLALLWEPGLLLENKDRSQGRLTAGGVLPDCHASHLCRLVRRIKPINQR
jgi:hypothetical protein